MTYALVPDAMTAARALARLHVPLLVAAGVALATGAALSDSPTIDEVGHLAAGLAVWHEGDFRLSPDHPPLARAVAALPVFLLPHEWPPAGAPGWSDGNFFAFARALFARNDPERLLLPARMAIVALLAATLLATWGTTRALFGRGAAALALLVAAFDPGLLAHGHYVTTDLPMALAALAALAAVARLLSRVTPARIAVAVLALSALALSKLSAVVVAPALAAMVLAAVLRPPEPPLEVPGRARRAAVLAGVGALLAIGTWAGVWAGYGFRYDALRGPDAATATIYPRALWGPPYPANMAEAWSLVERDPGSEAPRTGPAAAALRFARRHRLLPEAYLYGWTVLGRHAVGRVGYLRGAIYEGARLEYFPLAFAWKTPVATILLLLAGLVAIARGRARPADPVLAVGLAVFAATYAAAALRADLNIGHRHLLPLYPVVFATAGAAWSWTATRAGRVGVCALGAWLVLSTAAAAPGFLGYFNEIAGGSRGGYRLLADSNVDWSQDLVRLRGWMRARPGERVALLQSGRAPWPRGLEAAPLLPLEPGGPAAPLAPGWYVVSANELVGLFKPYQRAEAWRDPRLAQAYRALWAGDRFLDRAHAESFDALRRARIVSRLAAREPDDRIGASLFAFRLSDADLDVLARP